MNILVLGSGLMGYAAAFDLARSPGVTGVTLADQDAKTLESARSRIAEATGRAIDTVRVELPEDPTLPELLARHDACLSAVPYFFNAALARAAVGARTHFCDLGGNNTVVAEELALDADARRGGVRIIPDCGLAPGMVNVVAARAVELLGEGVVDHLRIRVGGLPAHPEPPLDYALFFSVHGLINEYIEPCLVLRDGETFTVDGLSETEEIEFAPPFGKMEAFQTSGGASTMPHSFRGRVRNLDYKTIRYPGHARQVRLLFDLGLGSTEPVALADGSTVAPRKLLTRLLETHLPPPGEDVILVRVEAEAGRDGATRRYRAELLCRPDRFGRSAMMRTTADPASVIAQMMVRGETGEPGAATPERAVPPGIFLRHLAERDLDLRETLDGQPLTLPDDRA
ncbi:MAG: saccharopine dehydrogenase C-terminal domain-containing protein [Gemmatimonadota bacterium]|nr:hypothetical protein [Gemmatimonadota bacterium]MDP6802877.1 saccharopine dehydrogenase C-terminal domain-containing protein [Gemmatimonadota bacterium]